MEILRMWFTAGSPSDDPGAQPPPSALPSHPALASDGMALKVTLAAAAVLVNAGLSIHLRLGLHWDIGVAALRCAAQLLSLGYLLSFVLHHNSWWLVLLYGAVTMLVASLEAVSRPTYHYEGMLGHTLASLSAGAGLMVLYASLVVLCLRPCALGAQGIIPLLAVLLGGAISAVSAGVNVALDAIAVGRDEIEWLLALGADRREATRWVVQRAWAAAVVPQLHHLSVAGLVSVPPLMAGQLLQGAGAVTAACQQVILLFLAFGACGLGSLGAVHLAVSHLVDEDHCLRLDRLDVRRHQSGVALYLRAHGRRILLRMHHALMRLLRRPQWNGGGGGRSGSGDGASANEHRRSLMVGELSRGRRRSGAAGGGGGGGSGAATDSLSPPLLGSGSGTGGTRGGGAAGVTVPQRIAGRLFHSSRRSPHMRVSGGVDAEDLGCGSYYQSISGGDELYDEDSTSGTFTSHQAEEGLEYEALQYSAAGSLNNGGGLQPCLPMPPPPR